MSDNNDIETKNKLRKALEAFCLYERLDDELYDECEKLIKPILDLSPISEEQKTKAIKIIRKFYKPSRNEDNDIVLLGYDRLICKVHSNSISK